ncbi:hypothetical protein [Corallococcus aberystwythensis]|uniref:hypothetical protein n=1 Tax=Corallococcus aberystwythensis TaxID=2316722 RepID=UPI0011C411D7|nr:hypothetical protein [Corallococcus aberystwythensis]
MDANDWAALGSMLAGLGTFAAVGAAVWAARSALPTALRQFRETKREENAGAVAQQLWIAGFRLMRELEALANPVIRGGDSGGAEPQEANRRDSSDAYNRANADQFKRISEASDAFLDAWGLAELHLSNDVEEVLKAVWMERAETLSAAGLFAMSLDTQPGTMPYAWGRLFGEEAKQRRVDCETALRKTLKPLARHEGPQALVHQGAFRPPK